VSENGLLKKRHYFDGRGRAEPIRWMLEETGTPYTENIIRTRDDMSRHSTLKSQCPIMFTLECLGNADF
jgi:glutathione S-transferase